MAVIFSTQVQIFVSDMMSFNTLINIVVMASCLLILLYWLHACTLEYTCGLTWYEQTDFSLRAERERLISFLREKQNKQIVFLTLNQIQINKPLS